MFIHYSRMACSNDDHRSRELQIRDKPAELLINSITLLKNFGAGSFAKEIVPVTPSFRISSISTLCSRFPEAGQPLDSSL
jgi:hypothetical protein